MKSLTMELDSIMKLINGTVDSLLKNLKDRQTDAQTEVIADNAAAIEDIESMKTMFLEAIKELAEELTWSVDAYGEDAHALKEMIVERKEGFEEKVASLLETFGIRMTTEVEHGDAAGEDARQQLEDVIAA